MADCYAIQNPHHGQTCTDDQYGEMAYNATDGTWEQLAYYKENKLSKLIDWGTFDVSGNKVTPTNKTLKEFFAKYGMWIIGGGAFLVVLLLLSYFSKPKK